MPRTLELLNELVAEGTSVVTPAALQARTGQSPQAATNTLTRLVEAGLLDRVARGRYVIRQIGLLGTSAAAEDAALAVGALFLNKAHRIAYRSALEYQDLLVHPARTIQVASPARVKVKTLSGRPLRTIIEKEEFIQVGAQRARESWVSDVERALIDAASRPDLIGGASVLAQALELASPNPERLLEYGRRLGAHSAIRRIGSLADQLRVRPLFGRLRPVVEPKSYIDLDLIRGTDREAELTSWRDRRWFVRWPVSVNELAT